MSTLRTLRHAFVCGLIALPLSACGNKGPLVKPLEPAAKVASAAAANLPTPAAATEPVHD